MDALVSHGQGILTLDDPANSLEDLMMFLNLFFAIFMELYGPNPRLIISKETTVITEPLRSDGYPDYRTFFRDLGREGVTHENNGAVLYWQALGKREMEHEDWLLLCEALGFREPPETSKLLQEPYHDEMLLHVAAWLTEYYSANLSETRRAQLESPAAQAILRDQAVSDIIALAQTRPWTTQQFPPMAEWIKDNAEPMKLLTKAVDRPKWWSPPPSLLGEQDGMLLDMHLTDIQNFRAVGRAFCVRAMWHAGEGRQREAWNDLLFLMKYSRIVAKRPTVVDQLVAIALNIQALEQIVVLLHHGQPDAELAQQILRDLDRLGQASDMVWAFDVGERLTLADAAIRISRDSKEWLRLTDGDRENFPLLLSFRLNWNQILRDSNRWIDRAIVCRHLPNAQQHRICMNEFNQDLESLSIHDLARENFPGVVFKIAKRTEFFSIIFQKMMLPALDGAVIAEDRSYMMIDLTRVAAALAINRAQNGHYSDEFEDLRPILDWLPIDTFSDDRLKYARKGDGYLLYSSYKNGLDDGGTHYNGKIVAGEWVSGEPHDIDHDESDIVFRVPVPAFAIPDASEIFDLIEAD